jgi:hypothetical protein
MIGDIRQIAHRLNGDVVGPDSVLAPGPGHSAKDRSLSVRLSPTAADGFVIFSHAGDGFAECRDHVRELLGLGEWRIVPSKNNSSRTATKEPRENLHTLPAAPDMRRIKEIWNGGRDPRGTLVETYLSNRGLELDDAVCIDVIRFHPSLYLDGDTTPGMVALYRDVVTDRACGIHRTFLDRQGRKIDRKMLGRARNAAIKLDRDDLVTMGLIIGEGVETCLAARMAGFRPCWALGSAGAIGAFPALKGIEALTILGETDDSGANEQATRTCARRWLEAGAEVIAVTPTCMGDLADIVREAAA